jgi:hypothetical protein
VCFNKETENEYFDAISVFEALRTIGALEDGVLVEEDPLVGLSMKKLYTTEYLADMLVTHCFGTFYGWRFLKGWFSFSDIFEPDRYHPPSDRRIEKIAEEARQDLRMVEGAKSLMNGLDIYGAQSPDKIQEETRMPNISNILTDADSGLSKIASKVRNYSSFALTYEKIRQAIKDSSWFRIVGNGTQVTAERQDALMKTLHKALLEGEPIIVEPPVLYFLLTLEFSDQKAVLSLDDPINEPIRRLVADCIRLYAIQRRFSSG